MNLMKDIALQEENPAEPNRHLQFNLNIISFSIFVNIIYFYMFQLSNSQQAMNAQYYSHVVCHVADIP